MSRTVLLSVDEAGSTRSFGPGSGPLIESGSTETCMRLKAIVAMGICERIGIDEV
jgi:hypothetical protein